MRILKMVTLIVLGVVLILALIPLNSDLKNTLPRLFHSYTPLPAPWLVPKKAGGSTLRMAMVHDVLHERFYLHGDAWFNHRHKRTERILAEYENGNKVKDITYFNALDDYAVDYDRLGKPADGVPLLRRKLDLQQPLDANGIRPPPAPAFYTTYANLGTLLAHVHMKGAIAKNPEAIAGLREGLSFIEQSIEVNPDAHFGRETWQAIAIRYLLAASERPELLIEVDMVGIEWNNIRHLYSRHGFPYQKIQTAFSTGVWEQMLTAHRASSVEENAKIFRESIPEFSYRELTWLPDNQKKPNSFSFDEPTLAFVGIWTLGSGANPHFALAFAHLMEGMNQYAIAWNAYERACELAGKFWPDPKAQQLLLTHCLERQALLEKHLGPSDSLRSIHREELAFGRVEQQAYQSYEAERIAAGHDPSEADFYAAFFSGRQPIASDPGLADTVIFKHPAAITDYLLILQAFVCFFVTLHLGKKVLIQRRELAK